MLHSHEHRNEAGLSACRTRVRAELARWTPRILKPSVLVSCVVTEIITYWKGFFALEVGTVVLNLLYYQEEDNVA